MSVLFLGELLSTLRHEAFQVVGVLPQRARQAQVLDAGCQVFRQREQDGDVRLRERVRVPPAREQDAQPMMEGHERYDGEALHPHFLDRRGDAAVSRLAAGCDCQEPGLTERFLGEYVQVGPDLIDDRRLELLPVLLECQVPRPGFQQEGEAAHVAGKQGRQARGGQARALELVVDAGDGRQKCPERGRVLHVLRALRTYALRHRIGSYGASFVVCRRRSCSRNASGSW